VKLSKETGRNAVQYKIWNFGVCGSESVPEKRKHRKKGLNWGNLYIESTMVSDDWIVRPVLSLSEIKSIISLYSIVVVHFLYGNHSQFFFFSHELISAEDGHIIYTRRVVSYTV